MSNDKSGTRIELNLIDPQLGVIQIDSNLFKFVIDCSHLIIGQIIRELNDRDQKRVQPNKISL